VRRHRRSRCILVLGREPLVVRAAHGLPPAGPDGYVLQVIQRAERESRGVLILDARQDRSLASAGWRSAVAVAAGPVVLCLVGDESGVFAHADLAELQKLAGEVSVEASPPAPEWSAADRALAYAASSLALAALLGLAGVTWAGTHRTPRPVQISTPQLPTVVTAEPQQIATNFLQAVGSRRFGEAHSLLSAARRRELSADELGRRLEAWLGVEEHRWDLQYRRAQPAGEGAVEVLPRADLKGVWRWTLVREEQGWKLDGFEGGPLSR